MDFYSRTDRHHPHLLPNQSNAHWQLLKEHLKGTAELARQFASNACPDDHDFALTAFWTGLLHDLGKYSDGFQQMLFDAAQGRTIVRTPHAIYGSSIAFREKIYDAALAILGHHAGLHALSEIKSIIDQQSIQIADKLARERAGLNDGLSALENKKPSIRRPGCQEAHDEDLRIRMLFSCLIDADRCDCYRHEHGILPKCTQSPDWPKIYKRLIAYIRSVAKQTAVEGVKECRSAVLNACISAAAKPGRLFSLAVPTGGGKTLASMAFAIKRLIERPGDARRIIVVIPYLSIIEQTAEVFKKALGESLILEHHSGDIDASCPVISDGTCRKFTGPVETEYDAFSDARIKRNVFEENWDAPIIVTTSVRFFESLYSNRPSDLRRIHNIARAIVILDEIQTLPKGFLATLLSMMRGLAKGWGTSFIFCTATQPAFEKPFDAKEDDGRWPRGTIVPIISDFLGQHLSRNLQRVCEPRWISREEKIGWEPLAAMLIRDRRALCIVNVKEHARILYRLLRQAAERTDIAASAVFHLSSRMCPQHRLDTMRFIRDMLRRDNCPCLVVSTQVVEAGVDLDFPLVYRAMGPLDAIVQAAGRCDREGKLTAAMGKPAGRLVLFEPEDDKTPYRGPTEITRLLAMSGGLSLYDPQHVRTYFNRLYEGDRDHFNIEPLRSRLDFPAIAERFAIIDDRTQAVLVPYNDEARTLIRKVRDSKGCDLTALRKISRYQVGLYPSEFDAAKTCMVIAELWRGAGIWEALTYSREIGLEIELPDLQQLVV